MKSQQIATIITNSICLALIIANMIINNCSGNNSAVLGWLCAAMYCIYSIVMTIAINKRDKLIDSLKQILVKMEDEKNDK